MVSEDTDGGPESVPPSSCSLGTTSIKQVNNSAVEGYSLQSRLMLRGVSK